MEDGTVKKYKTGTRADVLRRMAECAIRDQEGLIDAYTPPYGKIPDEALEVIKDCSLLIADFKLLIKEPKP
jgi:hypothetical protein